MQSFDAIDYDKGAGTTPELVTGESELSAKAADARIKLQQVIVPALESGLMSQKDAASITANSDNIRTLDDLRNLVRFVNQGIISQIQAYERINQSFETMMSGVRDILSTTSIEEWQERFRNASYQEKEYFLSRQFPTFIENWKAVAQKRKGIKEKARKNLSSKQISQLDVFLNDTQFRQLRFRDQKNLLGHVEAALAVNGKEGMPDLYKEAKAMLEKAASSKVMSKRKVGVWLDRIFNQEHDRKSIEKFINGELGVLIAAWANVAGRFKIVQDQIQSTDNMALKSQLVSLDKFLDMHYEQRQTRVVELAASLTASKNVKSENPILLRIRHLLDMKDWEEANQAIRDAQYMNFEKPEDNLRLQSMKEYLKQNRQDGKQTGKREIPNSEQVNQAKEKIDNILGSNGMDASMQELVKLLLPHGNKAINNLRWTVYNYKWCEKNGYLNEEKAQNLYSKNKDASVARAKQGEDPGLVDPIIYGDEKLIRNDEDQKKSTIRATLQYADLGNSGTRAKLAEWYKDRDPDILYWTTFIGCKDGHTLDSAWHEKQFEALTELRTATRTIENAGFIYNGPGKSLFSNN